ncbi:sugar ABC transporter permease [Paenibacillus oryzisoli]|uniref:carbohydrate ABC transporter permease n=1 Tax=Paenibacillus oryzisoli TaxID=1850517 RepID=UPI003D2A89F4
MILIRARRIIGAYLFLLPSLILFFSFDYLPTFSAFYYSLTEYHIFNAAKWVGFANYKQIMNDDMFAVSLGNSLQYFIIIVPLLVTLPLLLAILVNQKLKGIYVFRVVYYLPVITAMVAVAIVWKYMYHPAGLLNAVLHMFGVNTDKLNWLLNPHTALPAVSMLEIWKLLGYYMIIYLAGLQNLPKDLVEAARMDGATRLRVLWHVYLPHLQPLISLCVIMATLVSVQIFTSVYIMTGGGPLNSTISLPVYIYQKAFVELDMGYASAMGIVLFVILMVLTVINFKITKGKTGAV